MQSLPMLVRNSALALTLVAIAASASAQSGYPRKPILMLVPLQAASAVDNAARIMAQRMSENMGQAIVVENQPGAAGPGAVNVGRMRPGIARGALVLA